MDITGHGWCIPDNRSCHPGYVGLCCSLLYFNTDLVHYRESVCRHSHHRADRPVQLQLLHPAFDRYLLLQRYLALDRNLPGMAAEERQDSSEKWSQPDRNCCLQCVRCFYHRHCLCFGSVEYQAVSSVVCDRGNLYISMHNFYFVLGVCTTGKEAPS